MAHSRQLSIAAVLALLVIIPQIARADAIPVGSGWLAFAFGGSGDPAFGCGGGCALGGTSTEAPGDPPWTFTSASGVTLTITDAFSSGENFDVYDFGNLVGTTPFADLGYDCGDDPDVCVADPNFSHAAFSLGAGSHSLTFDAANSPFGGGSAYFRVDAATTADVPEPSTVLLVAWGALLLFNKNSRRPGCRKPFC